MRFTHFSLLYALFSLFPPTASAVSTTPAPVTGTVLAPLSEPKKLDLAALPPELGSLRLDGLVSRNGDNLPGRCSELAPIAHQAALDEPQRPGPLLVVGICARAAGDSVAAAAAFARLRERVEASLAPPGIWQGDAYYYGVGTLDVAAVAAALDPDQNTTLIASTLDASNDGHRLHEVLWLRTADARVRRVRVDLTPSAERVMRYLADRIDDPTSRDVHAAIAGYMAVNIQAGQLAADSSALVGRARIAARTGLYGGIEQARKDLDRAVAQDDAFARYAYAEWQLAQEDGDRRRALDLLRRAGEQHLPEAQVLLALWCELHKDCARGEAAAAQSAAVRAYGEAEVALLRYEAAQRLSLSGGERDLERALAKGSVRAMAVRIHQLAGSTDKRALREREALLRRGTADGLAYALEVRGLADYAGATTREARAAAREVLERAARRGSALAATQLGVSHVGGADDDAQRALRWHRLAAERGDALGQYNYATVLLNGTGIAADPAAARQWLLRSAMQGQPRSLRTLGDLYANGRGVAADAARAVHFYAAAARLGDARSQYLYALALDLGDGVTQNRDDARGWYERAAAQGSGDATIALARIELGGASPEAGIARLAACADAGDAPCRLVLAGTLMTGPESVRDVPRALALFEAAAAGGDARALLALGTIYLQGSGVAVDRPRAFGYFRRCEGIEGEGVDSCLARLGSAYRYGWGVDADRARAAEMLKRAQERGSAEATCVLGEIAREDGDAAHAAQWFAQSAAAGNAHCMLQHARVLLDGDATQAASAMTWLKKAAAAGNPQARVDIVAALLQPESPLRDEAAGIAYAEQCLREAAYDCVAAAGGVLLRRADRTDNARGLAWLETAANSGDAATARVLGYAAYYGYGRARDAAQARRWLTQADSSGLDGVLLARLDAAAGDVALAKDRLIRATRAGNAYAQLLLIDICALPGAECGGDAPTTSAWLANLERRGERRASELLNEVAWA
ncbi:MAG TPA: hypothetical protein VLF18_11570, partial [Tahibacter sp.]|uniref:tetratricopeptide repeat protein n=1 Tax=Tahibacter sp. TaxID=2056211 RepID=UPI002BFFB4B8